MLELREIDAGYAGARVLTGVDIAVPDASVVALLGPNGAGKTTVLRTLVGLLRPERGRVILDDGDMTMWSPDRRARAGIGYVREGRGIFRNLTVRENLRVQARSISASDALARAVEAFPILGRRLDQTAGTLSGGEQQMLALSRSYIENPRFLLLDEVSMGLAPRVVDEIFEFVARLARAGSGLLLVEQYVTRALQLADIVFVLNRGEVVFAGEPSELEDQDLFERYLGAAV